MQCLYFWGTHGTLLLLTSTSLQQALQDVQSLVCLEMIPLIMSLLQNLISPLGPHWKCCPGSDHLGRWSSDQMLV